MFPPPPRSPPPRIDDASPSLASQYRSAPSASSLSRSRQNLPSDVALFLCPSPPTLAHTHQRITRARPCPRRHTFPPPQPELPSSDAELTLPPHERPAPSLGPPDRSTPSSLVIPQPHLDANYILPPPDLSRIFLPVVGQDSPPALQHRPASPVLVSPTKIDPPLAPKHRPASPVIVPLPLPPLCRHRSNSSLLLTTAKIHTALPPAPPFLINTK